MCYAQYGGLAYFCCVPFFDNAGSFGAVNVFDGIKIDYLGRVLNYPDRYLSRYLCDVIFSVQQIRESVKA
jgi:hypothetical protein